MSKVYVDFHVIQTVPPSCVNRDDTGSPKTAIYGGATRARVSSQAWKKAMRDMFRDYFDESQLGVRTKKIVEMVCDEILKQDRNVSELNLADKVRETINFASAKPAKPILPAVKLKDIFKQLTELEKELEKTENSEKIMEFVEELKDLTLSIIPTCFNGMKTEQTIKKTTKQIEDYLKKTKKDDNKEVLLQQALLNSPLIANAIGADADALFFMGNNEARGIAGLVMNWIQNGDDHKPTKEKVQEVLNQDKENQSHAVDVALFGRMVAKAPNINADASAQVAHAISTHKVNNNEFDYFTAVDDRAPEDNAGASMIGTVEFNSSTLYRYATVAAHDLHRQLGHDDTALEKAINEFARAFVQSMPTGKQNTFANRTVPNALLVCIRKDQPVNLVGAFENPVKLENSKEGGDGFVLQSIKKLSTHAKSVYAFCRKPTKNFVIGEELQEALNNEGQVEVSDKIEDLSSLLNQLGSEVSKELEILTKL